MCDNCTCKQDEDLNEETPEVVEKDSSSIAFEQDPLVFSSIKKDTLIISAFPGTGKTWCYECIGDNSIILDSDSSTFDKSEFPANYIEHIKKYIGKVNVILVSSHDTVRAALREAGIEFYVVYPANTKTNKEEYMTRYVKRGSSEAFVKLMEEKWDDFIASIEEHPEDILIALPYTDLFLSHIVTALVQMQEFELPMGLLFVDGYKFIVDDSGSISVEIATQQWCELLNRSITEPKSTTAYQARSTRVRIAIETFADLWHSWENNKPHIMLPEGWNLIR